MHWVSLHVLFFFVIFCLLLVFFLRDVLGSNVAVRGGNLLVSTFFFCDGAGLPGIFCISFPAMAPQQWHPSNGTQQWHAWWHPAMAPQQWHPAMASSNGAQQWHPAMAPSNGTQQWRPAMDCCLLFITVARKD